MSEPASGEVCWFPLSKKQSENTLKCDSELLKIPVKFGLKQF